MFGRAPAVLIAALTMLIQGVLIFVLNDTSVNVATDYAWVVPLLTMLAGLLTHRKVVAKKTINDAGITTKTIKSRADDPEIPAARE